MKTSIYTLTSELHDEQSVNAVTQEFLNSLDISYDFKADDYSDYGTAPLSLIYVRTGGTEGIFRRLLPQLPNAHHPIYLLTSGKSNSLAASMEILSYLRQQQLQGEIIHGSAAYVSRRINLLQKAAEARRQLQGCRLGIIGEPSDWLISSHTDPAVVKERLGVELVNIPMQELLDGISQTPITQHPSPNTQHPSPNTQHPSPITQHPTPITQHPSPITHHPSPNTHHPTFQEMLRLSFKSDDTEEWLDKYFTRPIGLVFAIGWMKLGVHPNVVTILSIFLGIGAGYMFYFTDLTHNLLGVLLLMLANFCDSTDGQMARITGKKTLIGRMLDGFSGDVWFFAVYLALLLRMGRMWEPVLGLWAYLASFALCFTASIVCHSPQSSLADYYRQIHLYFLLGREGSELDSYSSQRRIYEQLPKNRWLDRIFYYNYANYCHSQEQRTPCFQRFFRQVKERWPNAEDMPQQLRDDFRCGSLPLMKYTNLLTFNSRAILIYITCLLNVPYVYPLVEITIYSLLYWHMHRTHERLCQSFSSKCW